MPLAQEQPLWTLSGRFFGYRTGDDLYTRGGKHIGRFRGNELFARTGVYIGEIRHDNRLACDRSKSEHRWSAFAAKPQRPPVAPLPDISAYPEHDGMVDFPAPELF